jgi:cell division protein FtsQ
MSATVAAPADKRFRRAHVKPARKGRVGLARAWMVLKVAGLCAMVAYASWRSIVLLTTSPALHVARIVVKGNKRVSTGEVEALLGQTGDQNILLVPLDDWRDRVAKHPWVEHASLRRVLPGAVEVDVHERTPMGIARLGRLLQLVAADGTLIDEYGPAYADLDLPIIDGLAASPAGAPLVDDARAALAARLLGDLRRRPDLAARVSQIDVSDARDAVVLLEDGLVQLRLGDRDFVERIQNYLDLSPVLRDRVAQIDTVDMRFGDRLFVRPTSGAGRAR